MKIWDKVKEKFAQMMENYRVKRKQKLLIKTDDDDFVIESLPADQDNSAYDIHEVVKNMESPQGMAKVVENNFEELIEQNMVRDTMEHLEDSAALRILNEHNDKLVENEKIKLAIDAIKSNDKKMKAITKNAENLTDYELAEVFETLRAEEDGEHKDQIERQKKNLVVKRILRNMVKHGGAWHIRELTGTLNKETKFIILRECLETVKEYEGQKKKYITSEAKVKLALDILRLTDFSEEEKRKYFDSELKECLSSDEIELGKRKIDQMEWQQIIKQDRKREQDESDKKGENR